MVVLPEWQGLGIGPRMSDTAAKLVNESGHQLYAKTPKACFVGSGVQRQQLSRAGMQDANAAARIRGEKGLGG